MKGRALLRAYLVAGPRPVAEVRVRLMDTWPTGYAIRVWRKALAAQQRRRNGGWEVDADLLEVDALDAAWHGRRQLANWCIYNSRREGVIELITIDGVPHLRLIEAER